MKGYMPPSKSIEWGTPQDLFDELDREFHFTLDPCATPESAKCEKFYTIEQDGLSKSWAGERVFMNPPYGRPLKQWVKKAYEESQKGAIVVCLLPSRTDVRWFHDYCIKGDIRFIKGRLKFGGAEHNAPFPSAIVIFNPTGRE